MHQQYQPLGNYLQNNMGQRNSAPNASIATMGPDTFQNSPFTQGGYNLGNQSFQNQQQNQQLQEQNYLQQVRQTLGTQGNYQQLAQQSQNYQQPSQSFSNFNQNVTAPNASVATMGPDTFQNSPFTQGGYNLGNQYFQNQQQNQQLQEQNYLQQVRQTLGTQNQY